MIALLFILREKCETHTLRNKMVSLKSILRFLHRSGKSEKKRKKICEPASGTLDVLP